MIKFQYSEQRRIAEILSTVDKKFEKVKKGLMNELLTGRKRVKVNMERD